jgi:hypothetical protein
MGDTQTLNYNEVVLEQYKLIVNSYETAQHQRISLNNVFVFIYSVIIGFYNFLANASSPINERGLFHSTYSIFIISVIVAALWGTIIIRAITAEKNKYKIMSMLEDQLPVRLFTMPKASSELDKRNGQKLFHPGYLELALPVFMMAVMAVNFVLLYFQVRSNLF